MPVTLHNSAQDFLDATLGFRAVNSLTLNMIGSVATSVAQGDRTYDRYFWWVIKDETGTVVGLAMRTAPHAMVMSAMPVSAIQELVTEVVLHDDDLPEVGGPVATVDEFLRTYEETKSLGSQRKTELSHQEWLYALQELKSPVIAGEARQATSEDFELIYKWFVAFGEEAGLFMHNTVESIQDGLKRGSLFFWLHNGEIVSLAGHAPLVDIPDAVVGRIGPVYTPLVQRKKGFAGALTAHVSQLLLNLGAQVILYTDATNPTSNSVYQRIGFEKIGESKRVKFLEP